MENNFKEQVLTMLAENGGIHTVGGKTFSVTVVTTEPQPTPDYSHLVGKWVKSTGADHTIDGRYYLVTKYKYGDLYIKDEKEVFAYNPKNGIVQLAFDISNPLDHNPDTRIPLPEGVEFVSRSSVGDFCFKINDKQQLGFNEETKTYFVNAVYYLDEAQPCHLEPCEYGELKEGEFFVLNEAVFLKTKDADVYVEKSGKVDVTEQLISTYTVHRVVRANN
jgi:hypothetical protein